MVDAVAPVESADSDGKGRGRERRFGYVGWKVEKGRRTRKAAYSYPHQSGDVTHCDTEISST